MLSSLQLGLMTSLNKRKLSPESFTLILTKVCPYNTTVIVCVVHVYTCVHACKYKVHVHSIYIIYMHTCTCTCI